MALSSDLISQFVQVTKDDKNAVNYGVNFELVMPKLIKLLENER